MNKSFTLIEILAIVVVLGFLSSFIIIHLDSVGGLFKNSRAIAFSNSLKNSLLVDLVTQYNFNGDSNDSWYLNNGTMNNFPADPWKNRSECIEKECLTFDGEDDWINCGSDSSLDLYSEFTVEAWIKITGNRLGVHACPIMKGLTSWMFYVDSERNPNRNVCFAGRKSDDSDWLFWLKVMYSLDEWFHMTGTFSSSQGFAKVYKNGTMTDRLEEGIQGSVLYIPADTNLRIGYIWEEGYFLGEIDQIRIYKVALTNVQVESNYYAGINRLLINGKISSQEFAQRVGELSK